MRFKADGALDEVWRARRVPVMPPVRTAEELERMRGELIEELVRDYPTMTRERATELIDAFF
jgi:hypothetical protein